MSINKHQQYIFEQILSKFIINLPSQEIEDSNRLAYQAEKAFYYYIDRVLNTSNNTKDYQKQRNQFFVTLAKFAPSSLRIDPRKLAMKIQQNKPVCGAIIFNKDQSKVLIIRVRNKFGFPKGKWNQHESARDCAAREVQEETGIYIHNRIDPNISIEFESHGSNTYFFVARGISEEDRLRIDTKQIDQIFWMRVQDIEPNKFKLAQKSRIAWEHYSKLTKQAQTKVNLFEQFLQKYRKQGVITAENIDENPFLSFKFNRQNLKKALLAGLCEQ